MAPVRSLLDRPLEIPIDPLTGRITFATGIDATHVGITVREGKKERQVPLDVPPSVGVDMIWIDGSLLVTHSTSAGDGIVLSFVSIRGNVATEHQIATVPVVGHRPPGLVAVTNGYALFSYGRALPEVRNRLLLVRLSDGRRTAIDADGLPGTIETYGFGGWLTP